MKKITQQRSNLRCVFSGKADSLPCETRKGKPQFLQPEVCFCGFDYQFYHFYSTVSLLRVQRWCQGHTSTMKCFRTRTSGFLNNPQVFHAV